METKVNRYQAELRTLQDWDAYLLAESGLPGPRGNIELAQAVATEGDRERFERYVAYTAEVAPVNSPYEYLAFCGILGLGRLLAEGDCSLLVALRGHASDPRWRVREAVAMALQELGDVDMGRLVGAMRGWATGTPLEQRAAAAALCEPRLLRETEHVRATLDLLDLITASIEHVRDRRSEDFRALRKGLGYCWSVSVVALPNDGRRLMEKWCASTDRDILWIIRENLKKARLARMDHEWVSQQRTKVEG